MQRRQILICVGLAAVIAGGALSAGFLWRHKERAAIAISGTAAAPDLSRWPVQLGEEISRQSSAVAHSRSPAEALAGLAELYCANGFTPEAEQAIAALRRLEPKNARWPYLEADLHLRDSDQEGAEKAFQAALELNPRYAPGWLRLGELQQGLAELDRARDSFARALAADPQGVWAQYDSIFFEAQHGGDADSARRRLAELALAHPDIKEVHELLADLLAAARDSPGAARERQLAAQSELNMGAADPWIDELTQRCFDSNRLVLRGIEMRREGRFGEAEALFRRAVELAPQVPANPLPWDLLSNFYLKMNRPAEARATLESAVAAFPDEPEMPLLLARLLCAEHKPQAAAAAARGAILRWPRRGDLHAALGRALDDAGDYAAAEKELRDALALDPALTEAQCNLGTCLIELGRADDARVELGKALSMRPDYPEALFALGSLDLEAGDFAAAEPYATKLWSLDPDDPNARLLLANWHLVKGLAAGNSGTLDEADSQFRAGLEVSPEHGPLLLAAGSLALQRGKPADAEEAFEHYVKVEPADPQGYRALGLVLQRLGRTADAAAAFRGGLGAAQKAGDQALVEEFKGLLGR